jgi:hypothetical protein
MGGGCCKVETGDGEVERDGDPSGEVEDVGEVEEAVDTGVEGDATPVSRQPLASPPTQGKAASKKERPPPHQHAPPPEEAESQAPRTRPSDTARPPGFAVPQQGGAAARRHAPPLAQRYSVAAESEGMPAPPPHHSEACRPPKTVATTKMATWPAAARPVGEPALWPAVARPAGVPALWPAAPWATAAMPWPGTLCPAAAWRATPAMTRRPAEVVVTRLAEAA